MEKVITLVRTTTNQNLNDYQIKNLNAYCREKSYRIERCYTNQFLAFMKVDDILPVIEFAKAAGIKKVVVWSLRFLGSHLRYIKRSIELLQESGISLVLAGSDTEIGTDKSSQFFMTTLEEVMMMCKISEGDQKFKQQMFYMRISKTKYSIVKTYKS